MITISFSLFVITCVTFCEIATADVQSAIACEGHGLNVRCPTGSIIVVKSANYGRTNGETCPHPQTANRNCHAGSSLNVVTELCNNKSQCSIPATNGVFGDPCVGTYKYIQVQYTCEKDTQSMIACEGHSLNVECPTGSIIVVKSASYGRTNGDTCPHPQMGNRNCHAGASLNIVTELCNNKRQCSIPATNGVFGDPCVNTYKYLTVQYTCEKETQNSEMSAISCEGHNLNVECPTGSIIAVKSANYGRTNGVTCPHPQMGNRNCHAGASLNVVTELCNNKRQCTIPATNGVFGDPCVNTYKYLTVQYTCKKETQNSEMSAISCEGHSLNMECPTGTLIVAKSANYGRTNGATCPHPQTANRNCHAGTSLNVVTKLCNNKRQCSVAATNGVFGDPCVGTYKYLSVEFACEKASLCKKEEFQCTDGSCVPEAAIWNGYRDCPGGEDEAGADYETKYACEGHTMDLNCRRGEVLSVVSANYGRLTKKICVHNLMSNTNCKAGISLANVKNRCNQKASCSIPSTNQFFGDPCVGTYKYTEVHYQCVPLPNCTENEFRCNNGHCIEKSKVCDGTWNCEEGEDEHACEYLTDWECEHSTLHLECQQDHIIKIIGANYGRQSRQLCTYQDNTNCTAIGAQKKVSDICDGNRKCSVGATNAVFGDPCVGTIKYLIVNYMCIGTNSNFIGYKEPSAV